MKEARNYRPLTSHLARRSTITSEVITLLIAEAISQGYIAEGAIEGLAIPHLPAQQRGFATDILRRMQGMDMFGENFLRDLEAFIARLEEHVEAGTSIHWQTDEYHIDGGYTVTSQASDAKALSMAAHELKSLRDRLVAALSAGRAAREVDELLEE